MAHKNTHQESIIKNTKVIEAIEKYFHGDQPLVIGGESIAPAEIKARLRAEVDATKTLHATRATLREQVNASRAAKALGQRTRSALRNYILGTYGAAAVAMFEEFGFKRPASSSTRTVEGKTAAVAKAKATRLARHTMGKKQRLAIKGVVSPAVVDAHPHDAE